MDIYSICPSGTGEPMQQFQGNRDIPITSQPLNEECQFTIEEVNSPTDSSYLHAIQFLRSSEKLYIQQNTALLEMVLSIDLRNKYNVLNPFGQKIFLATEESGCCFRYMCGSFRNFEMHLFDNMNNEVIRMYRYLGCTCCPFWREKIKVFCPTEVLVGFVEQQFSLLHSKFGVFDRDNTLVLRIEGPGYQCKCCKDVNYKITNLTGEDIGTISKQWMGFLQEGFTDSDSFRLEFPLDLDVNMKMLLLGATFLIDYLFYERNKSSLI